MALVGSLSLVLSLLAALSGVILALRVAGSKSGQSRPSPRSALLAVAGLATLASVSLLYLLLTRDYQVAYVHEQVSSHLPWVYTISAFWAGQEGSLLLWFWMLTALAVWASGDPRLPEESRPYVMAVFALAEAFFALALLTTSDPFATYATRPDEGRGMLPLLQNPGMIVHPPVLFLGYAAYTVPFAHALAALASGALGGRWLRAVRRWSLLAWLALSCGILIGAWWSYVELGWGGYWAWDPVENASLIPWLLGTAFLHSAMAEERRGLQRLWNIALPTLAFVACLFATLVTRGGLIVSDLHGFAASVQPIAYLLVSAIVASLLAAAVLARRRRADLRSLREVEQLLTRESSFLFVNLLLCGAALAVFIGTASPALLRAASGQLISLNTSFYNRAVGPILWVVIVLMGACPVLAWGRATPRRTRRLGLLAAGALLCGAAALALGIRQPIALVSTATCAFVLLSILSIVWRDVAVHRRTRLESLLRTAAGVFASSRRRYGAYTVHLAMVLMAAGIVGSSLYKQQSIVTLARGDSANFAGYVLTYQDLEMAAFDAEPVTYQSRLRFGALVEVSRGNSSSSRLVAEKNYHPALDSPWVTEVAIHSTWLEDLYVALGDLDQQGVATFQLTLNPLVGWIWAGGAVLLAGTLLALWPQDRPETREG